MANNKDDLIQIRIRKTKKAEAMKLGLNISEITREAIDRAILTASGKCPTCGAIWLPVVGSVGKKKG